MHTPLLKIFEERGLRFSIDETGRKNLICVINEKCVIQVNADVACHENPVTLRTHVGVLPSRPGNMGNVLKKIARLNNALVMRGYGLAPSHCTKKIDLVWLHPSNSRNDHKKIVSQLRGFAIDASLVKENLRSPRL